jgi:hypothetical protein
MKNEMGGTCGTHGGEVECIQGFGWENLEIGRDHLEDLGADVRIILKCILSK